MLAAVSTNISLALGVITAIVGSIGGVLAALRFNREEAGKTVTQQNQILEGMRGLNDELGEALQRARDERDQWRGEAEELRVETGRLREEVEKLRVEVARLNKDRGGR